MIALGLVDQTRHILGIPGSVMALTAVMAGALAGPVVGAGVAIAGGAVYYITVASSGARGDTLASIVSVALWVSTGVVSGLLADALREQAEKRRDAAAIWPPQTRPGGRRTKWRFCTPASRRLCCHRSR